MPIITPGNILPNQNKGSGIISFIAQFAVVAIIFFGIGFIAGQKKIEITNRNFVPHITVQNKLPPKEQTVDFSLFWQVFETLPETYLDKSAIDAQKMVNGAIAGMVRSLGDPYTVFLDPKQNEAIRSELSGTYEGVGIQLGFNKEKRLAVIAPLSQTPAERAGVLPQDLILKIGDRETFDVTLPEAVDLIRGPAGTKIKLQIAREGQTEPIELEMQREKITVKSVEVNFRDFEGKKVAILKVSRFGETTDSEWDEAVNRVQLEGAKAVVVDMRNNPGGLLSSSVHLASEFVGGVIVKQQFSDGSVRNLDEDHNGELLNIPLAVLVNGGSASAAEIFAGAIQDKNRGQIVGEKTFGKGTVQDALELPGNAGLHVTIAKWLTPKGNSIHNEGITPDVTIEPPQGQMGQRDDPQLNKALEEL
ncbi:MAG: S41 family peptidase [Candidatus Curtissbacteria bacterium]|nr:S41 family peptidase [Candidatus Curtissbacteria bacterium]